MAHQAAPAFHRHVLGKRQLAVATTARGGAATATDPGAPDTTQGGATTDSGSTTTADTGGGGGQTTTQRTTTQASDSDPTTTRQAPSTTFVAPSTTASRTTTSSSDTTDDLPTSTSSIPSTTSSSTTSASSIAILTPLSIPTIVSLSSSSSVPDFSTSIQVISGNPINFSSSSALPSTLNTNSHPPGHSGGLSTTATAAIAVVCSLVGVAVVFWLGVQVANSKRRKREQKEMDDIDFDPAGNGSNASGFGDGDDLHGALGIKRDDSLRARSDGGDARDLAEVSYEGDADRREREEIYHDYLHSIAPVAPSSSGHDHNQSFSSNGGVPTLPQGMSTTTMATSGSAGGLSRAPTNATMLSRQPTNPAMYHSPQHNPQHRGYHPQPAYGANDAGLQRQETLMSSVGGPVSRQPMGYGSYAQQQGYAPHYGGYPAPQQQQQYYEGFDGGYQNGHVQGQRSQDSNYVIAQGDPQYPYNNSPPPPPQRELYNPNTWHDQNRLSVASTSGPNGAPLNQRRSLRNYASNGQMALEPLQEEDHVAASRRHARSDSVGTAREPTGFGNLRLVEH